MDKGYHITADGVILVELPAAVGEQVWIVSGQKKRIYTNRIAEYVIRGNRPGKNSVKLSFTDKNGFLRESWWDMSAFGKTIFTDRNEALKQMEEMWNDDVV